MDNVKQQIVERLKQANNILVTVKTDPTIDLLSACIGLSLLLDKLDKHAAAVFSGEVPSTLEFLKPQDTLESTPDSLRDFIIALDKSKADKLRYKVEDKVVRIFITPYKASITQDDLEFSQGDFNIDVVIALGVHDPAELDAAITAHGRILHDATVISINNTPNGNLGAINWQAISASSVSEMIADLAPSLGENLLDEQIATALLTGVVSETARFSNDKTTPQVMRVAGELMAAGANQQLVANELKDTITSPTPASGVAPAVSGDGGALDIDHPPESAAPVVPSEQPIEEKTEPIAQITPSRDMLPLSETTSTANASPQPLADGAFTASYNDDTPNAQNSFLVDNKATETKPAADMAATVTAPPNPFASPTIQPLPTPAQPVAPTMPAPAPSLPSSPPALPVEPSVATPTPPPTQTLDQLEQSIGSTHLSPGNPSVDQQPNAEAGTVMLDDARSQVLAALQQTPDVSPPADFNAAPLGDPLHDDGPAAAEQTHDDTPRSMSIEVDQEGNLKIPQTPPSVPLPPVMPNGTDSMTPGSPNAPPPAPPPLSL